MTNRFDIKELALSFKVNLALVFVSVIFYSNLSYALLLGVMNFDHEIGSRSDFFTFSILLLWLVWLVASAVAIFIVSWRRPAKFIGTAFVLSGLLLVLPLML